jgi:SAM-dependent methyltransferase
METELQAVTARQQGSWATGDFHRIGVAQIVVGERLVISLGVHAGERVLDVAGGAGNTALAAARRLADVTCTDYVPALLDRAAERARAEGLALRVEPADAQALPYPDGTFDVVTSTFGAMFAPDQQTTADELLRVLRPGGRLGMANWTPTGWVGRQFALTAGFAPPPAGVRPPSDWGTTDRLAELFGGGVTDISTQLQQSHFVHHDVRSLFALFREWFGPVATLWAALDAPQRQAFADAWTALAEEFNSATDGTCAITGDYLEVVARRA